MSKPRYTNIVSALDLTDLEAIITSINIAFFCVNVPVKGNYEGATKLLRKERDGEKVFYSVLSNGGGHNIQTHLKTELPALAISEYNRLFADGQYLQHTLDSQPFFFQANGF
jgi:hypothetical protein